MTFNSSPEGDADPPDSSAGFAAWQTWARPGAVATPSPAVEVPVVAPVAGPTEAPTDWGTMARVPRLADWPDGEWRFATFGERFGAALIDGVIILTMSLVILPFEILFFGQSLLGEFLSLIYICAANAYGRSFGKSALGIEIVNRDWKRPGIVAGFVRWLISNVSGLFLLLGYFNVIWDREKRTWHDHAAGTWVVCRRWPTVDEPSS